MKSLWQLGYLRKNYKIYFTSYIFIYLLKKIFFYSQKVCSQPQIMKVNKIYIIYIYSFVLNERIENQI